MSGSRLEPVAWAAGAWTTEPLAATEGVLGLEVAAVQGSDAWRHTSYGFVHDDAHALLAPLAEPAAVEVAVDADFDGQFDQAGLMLRVDEQTWLKAGLEYADGVLQVGAVVTLGRSDWSVSPVPEWAGRTITIRASRSGDAVTVRARAGDEPFRLVRVAYFPPGAEAHAGPYCAAPSRSGLVVRFRLWSTGPADATLH